MSDSKDQLQDSAIPERAKEKIDATKEPAPPARVLVVHAHPDDQEFTVGGTLAKWARAGSFIVSVCVTSGDAGSNEKTDAAMTRQMLPLIREEEQRAANHVLGINETIFMRYPDGELEPTLQLRRELTRLIRKFKPDAVLCGDPTVRYYGSNYMNHPDHRAASSATLDAVFPSAGTRFIFTNLLQEGFEPHNVKWVFIHGAEKPDTWIDISETIDLKIQALQEHRTQVGGWDIAKEMRAWAAEEGKPRGIAFAEAYRLMVLVEEKPEAKKEEAEAKV